MSKLYIVLGKKPISRGWTQDMVLSVESENPDVIVGPYSSIYECVHFVCDTKERVKEIKNSYIEIVNIYEIDANLINIDDLGEENSI